LAPPGGLPSIVSDSSEDEPRLAKQCGRYEKDEVFPAASVVTVPTDTGADPGGVMNIVNVRFGVAPFSVNLSSVGPPPVWHCPMITVPDPFSPGTGVTGGASAELAGLDTYNRVRLSFGPGPGGTRG